MMCILFFHQYHKIFFNKKAIRVERIMLEVENLNVNAPTIQGQRRRYDLFFPELHMQNCR